MENAPLITMLSREVPGYVMHRVSYWKTTGIALAGVVLTLSALLWLNSASGHRTVLAASTFLSVLLLIAFVFIAAGGLVCLWRDAREASGTPDMFAPLANRVPTGGLLSRVGLRFLRGPRLRPGDVVSVRSWSEIQATLDAAGTLDGLPFMAEMMDRRAAPSPPAFDRSDACRTH